MPEVVVNVLLEIPVVIPRTTHGEGNPILISTATAQLPTLTTLAPLGNIGFPAAVGPFLDPDRNAKGVTTVENALGTAVRNGNVLIAVQVDRLTGSKGYVGFVNVCR